MSKGEIRRIVESRMIGASIEDKKRMIELFEDLYETEIAKGKVEEEIMKELGMREAVIPKRSHSLPKKVMIGIGLLLFNLIVALGPIVMLLSIYISLWSVAVAGIALAAYLLISLFFIHDMSALQSLFLSMIMSGLGVLLIIGLIFAGKLLYKGFVFYIGLHMKMIRGE